MSRGIDRTTAQKLIVFGFFGDVLDRIRVPSVRDRLADAIATKVEGGKSLELGDVFEPLEKESA
jgi:Fe-S cluster assembly scaffold protein SufB